MPFEVQVDALKDGKATSLGTLKRIEKLEKVFEARPEFAKPLSITSAMKFSRQAYFNGLPAMYELPSGRERGFILSYTKGADDDGKLRLRRSDQLSLIFVHVFFSVIMGSRPIRSDKKPLREPKAKKAPNRDKTEEA